jgi:uncharacterized protein (TIGR02597 family)
MNATSSLRLPLCALTAVLSFGLGSHAFAQSVSTTPVGAVTFTIPANSTRAISMPLQESVDSSAGSVGRITGVTSATISNASAAWTAGAYSSTSVPYYVRITSGVAQGRIFLVSTSTANTSTTLTVNNDGSDLTGLGILVGSSGDTYEIVPCETLSSLFGNSILQGGVDANTADNVLVWNGGSYLTFYYNATRSRWERNVDTAVSPTRDNFVLRPDRGIMIQRNAGTDLVFSITGRVPSTTSRIVLARPGTTFIAHGFPVDISLGDLALQLTPGWVGSNDRGTAASTADLVQVWNNGSWLTFYYDTGTSQWQRAGDSANTNRNGYSVTTGRPIMITRTTADSNAAVASFVIPYSLGI